jgi:hypothetical protein
MGANAENNTGNNIDMKINLFMYKYPVFQFRDMGKVTSNHMIRIPYDNQVCQNLVSSTFQKAKLSTSISSAKKYDLFIEPLTRELRYFGKKFYPPEKGMHVLDVEFRCVMRF